MAVLTEITNSDKDLLLNGDCTIKTELLISDTKLPGPSYEMQYDTENDYYYLNGESYQNITENSPSPDYPSPISSITGQIQMVVPYPTDKKLLMVDLGENELCSLPNNVFDKLVYDTKRNIFDKNATFKTNGATKEVLDTGVRSKLINSGNYRYFSIELGKSELLGKTIILNRTITNSASNIGQIALYFGNETSQSKKIIFANKKSGTSNIYIPNTFPDDCDRIWILFYGNVAGTGNIGDYTDYTDLTVSITNKPIKYKPYRATDAYIDKQVTKRTFTGVESWNKDNDTNEITDYFYILNTGINANNINFVMTDYFTKGDSATQGFWATTVFCITINKEFTNITTSDSKAVRINKFKDWLSNHHTTVCYKLETPTEISLSTYSTQDITILTETNSVKDWTIDDERYVPDVGFFGQFTAKQLSGNLQNITDDFNIENKYVEVRMGISKFKSTTTNWYSRGTYIISKPNDDEVSDNTKYTGYDLTILFNIPFDAKFTNEGFTKSFNEMLEEQSYVTNGWLADYTCAQTGVKLGTPDFIHSDFKILSNQFTSGETCRDIMKYISELAFGYCEVDCDDMCYIRTLNTDYVNFDKYHKLDYNQYYSLETQKNSYGPVNRVFCGLQDVEGQGHELIDGNSTSTDITTINIYNNPLTMGTTLEISNQLQSEAIQDCDILWGIQYRPITKMETIGHPWLKAYEPIEVSDMELNKIITYPFTNTLKYTGHIKSDISSEGETKTEDTYGYKDSVERRMNRIGINVDRAKKEITIINQEITKIGDDIKDIRGNMLTIGDVYTKSEIRDIVSGVGVDGTVVTSLETATTIFDINGMTIGRTDAQTKTNVNANGMIISNANNNTELLKINNQGVYSENLTARTYLNFGTHGRFEKYNEGGQDRIGCFWIEGDE